MGNDSALATQYVSYNDDIWLHVRPDGALIGGAGTVPLGRQSILVQEKMAKGLLRPSGFMNKTASRLANLMDGDRTTAEIVDAVLDGTEVTNDFRASMLGFIREETTKGFATAHPRRHKARFRHTGSLELYYPNLVNIELTYRCNCQCKHCYIEAGDVQSQRKELTGDQFIEILRPMIDHGLCGVELTGGECLMHPDFWKIAEFLSSQQVIWMILTNGMLVTERTVDRLVELGIDGIQISLDGPNAEVHDTFRQTPGSFETATRAIKLFAKTGRSLRVATSVFSGNFHLIDDILGLARQLGATRYAASPITNNGRAARDGVSLALSRDELRIFLEVYTRNIGRFGVDFMQVILPKTADDEVHRYLKNCGLATSSIALSPYGDVRPCLMAPPSFTLGNLLTTPYDEVLAKNHLLAEVPADADEACLECPAWGMCGACVVLELQAYCRMRLKGSEACRWGKKHGASRLLNSFGWNAAEIASGGCSHDACDPGIPL